MLNTINILISYFLSNSTYRLVFAFATGLFLGTSLPFIGFSWVAWVGLIPLIILVKSSDSLTNSIKESLIFISGYNLISFFWLWTLHPLTWQGFNIQESFLIALLAWILPVIFHSMLIIPFAIVMKLFFRFLTNQRSKELHLFDMLFLSAIWVILEHKFILNLGPVGIFAVPVNLIVYSQYQNILLIQICNIIGAIGLELIIVICNLCLSNFFNVQLLKTGTIHRSELVSARSFNIKRPFSGIQDTEKSLINFTFLLVTFFVILLYGFTQTLDLDKKKSGFPKRRFALVQANLSAEKTRGQNLDIPNIIETLCQLTSKLKWHKDIIVWPEGSLPTLDSKFYLQRPPLIDIAEKASVFAFGTYLPDPNENNEKIYNGIHFVDQGISKFYYKQNLVPFGEYTPLISVFPKSLKELARSSIGGGFSSGLNNPEPIEISWGKIASTVCFELLFPQLVREQVLKGANFIINLNDLSWFRTDMVKKQFLAVAVFRAVENKRDLLLAGNAGYTARISAIGEILTDTALTKEPGVLEGSFTIHKDLSIYTKYGW